MKNISDFVNTGVRFVFTDIDDTMTENGFLSPAAFAAIWKLYSSGIHVVPVTGRPAGWCELIARQWPVSGVIGENGGFYFRYTNKKMKRHFANENSARIDNQKRLEKIRAEILTSVPGSAIASDQFCRMMDLAVDYCEDVPTLPPTAVEQIVAIFNKHGAQAKVSSIHVNGWFGQYNKLSMCQVFCEKEFQLQMTDHQNQIAFVGDSPNDEPMFEFFNNSFGVANINSFTKQIQKWPQYVSNKSHGEGFAEIAQKFL